MPGEPSTVSPRHMWDKTNVYASALRPFREIMKPACTYCACFALVVLSGVTVTTAWKIPGVGASEAAVGKTKTFSRFPVVTHIDPVDVAKPKPKPTVYSRPTKRPDDQGPSVQAPPPPVQSGTQPTCIW